MLTKLQLDHCELVANIILEYRAALPTSSPCWMEEWAFGYLCALRDDLTINELQWRLLVKAFSEALMEHD